MTPYRDIGGAIHRVATAPEHLIAQAALLGGTLCVVSAYWYVQCNTTPNSTGYWATPEEAVAAFAKMKDEGS